MNSSLDTFLFTKIKNILRNPEIKDKYVNKQRRIEKLVNVFLLKKEENKYVAILYMKIMNTLILKL